MTDVSSSESFTVSQALVDADMASSRHVDPMLAKRARQAARDGVVLLRNDGDVLPLAPQSRVAVFGRCQIDWIHVGYGSGGDVNAAYTTNLLDPLIESGQVRVDTQLADEYRRWCATNPINNSDWGHWPLSYPEMGVDDAVIQLAAQRNDTAIIVLGRAAGEDRDMEPQPGSYFLTDDERRLLGQVTDAFEKVIAIVATGNVIDLTWAQEFGVSALMLAWFGGMEGGRAVADVLVGSDEPGGRLTETIADGLNAYPTTDQFGRSDYTNYTEDVYVGYRWFSTFANQRVLYPFGFGLGYTSFEMDAQVTCGNGTTTVTTTVHNTGIRTGREVVQVYAGGPQTASGRPSRSLVAFAKTGHIKPGQSTTITVRFPDSALAIFDDSGITGHKDSWVIEAGSYPIYVGQSVASAREVDHVVIPDTVVVTQLEECLAPIQDFERTVAHYEDGMPIAATEPVPTTTVNLRNRILDRLPEPLPRNTNNTIDCDDVVSGNASLEDFVAALSVDQLTSLSFGGVVMNHPLGPDGNAGILGGVTESLRARGIPPLVTTDGPSGIRLRAYASLIPCGTALASSWDVEAVQRLHESLGAECRAKNTDILLSPGMNIQRSVLGGRNFEYFSEDPLLNGRIADGVVRGLQSQGVSACLKHFAANNQEAHRTQVDVRVSQRALREIYLRGFEIAVAEGKPWNIMTSYNKINGVWSHYNYDLCTTILRHEWGYQGNVMTDWWMHMAPSPEFPGVRDSGYRVRAQVDVLMPGGSGHHGEELDDGVQVSLDTDEGLTIGELQRGARNVLSQLIARQEARSTVR